MNRAIYEAPDSYGYCHACGHRSKNIVDGTNRWICPDCIALAVRAAEAVLWPDREYHRNHDIPLTGCPYCYPGAVA